MKQQAYILLAFILVVITVGAVAVTSASAEAPSRVRELTCSDGTTFTGEQVRMGGGLPPHMWRNVEPGAQPAGFNFHAASVIALDGTVVETFTWDYSQGVEINHDLVICSFIIPIGPLTGYRTDFVGFFLP